MGGIAGLLLSAAAGYWVLERAEHERGRLKTIGRVVAGLILVLSFGGVVCRFYAVTAGQPGGKSWCPFSQGYLSKETPPAQPSK